jgi:hypothetical protein
MTTCKHADSGCNYPEGECLGVCTGTKQEPAFAVGDRVIALVNMDNDLSDEGFGVQHCASKGDALIVRRVGWSGGCVNCIAVSHEHITDRTFGVAPHEIAKATRSSTS